MENTANKLKQLSERMVPVGEKHCTLTLQSPIWKGCGYVVCGLYPGRAEWRTALVPWGKRDWPALHHSEGARPTASRADEALLQQPTLPWLAGKRKLCSFFSSYNLLTQYLHYCHCCCKGSFHLECYLLHVFLCKYRIFRSWGIHNSKSNSNYTIIELDK